MPRRLLCATLFLAVSVATDGRAIAAPLYVSANDGTISQVGDDGGVTTIAKGPPQPGGMAVDRAGNVFEVSNGRILKISADGQVLRFASPTTAYGLAFDSKGYLYGASGVINRFGPDGSVSVYSRQTVQPVNLAVDGADNLYATDQGFLERLTPAGDFSKVANLGFPNIYGLAVSPDGDVYAAQSTGPILRITPAGEISTFVNGVYAAGLAFDSEGTLYAASPINGIMTISPGGQVATLPVNIPGPSFLAFAVPEPASAGLVACVGLLLLSARRRRPIAGASPSRG